MSYASREHCFMDCCLSHSVVCGFKPTENLKLLSKVRAQSLAFCGKLVDLCHLFSAQSIHALKCE